MILILMLFVTFCVCLLLYRGMAEELLTELGVMVFYYNNKITRAFNTPSTLHTHFLSAPTSSPASEITAFHIFVASSRNFPRYLFHSNARFFFFFSILSFPSLDCAVKKLHVKDTFHSPSEL